MKITVIRVMVDGEVGYLKTFKPTCMDLGENQIVKSPLQAFDFTNNDVAYRAALAALVVPGDMSFPKSGLRIDKLPEVAIFEVRPVEVECRVAREFHRE